MPRHRAAEDRDQRAPCRGFLPVAAPHGQCPQQQHERQRMFADRQCQCGDRQRPAPAARPMEAEGQRHQHPRPQFVQDEVIAVEAERCAHQHERGADPAHPQAAGFFAQPPPPRPDGRRHQGDRQHDHAALAQPGMDIGERGQAHGKAGAHGIIMRALFPDDKVVIGLAARNPLDHRIVKGEIVVAQRFAAGCRCALRRTRCGRCRHIAIDRQRRQRGKHQQDRHQREQHPRRPCAPMGEAVPAGHRAAAA